MLCVLLLLQLNGYAADEQWAVAKGMESLMIDQMIQQMRKTVPENEFITKSQSEKIYEQMLDSEYARVISESGTIGIAGLIVEQIQGKRIK